jgi:hypothetical protein
VVEQRASNQGALGRTKTFMQEWGWIFYLVGGILLALGFSYKTPSGEIKDIKDEQTILRGAVEELKNTTKTQANDISIIVRLQCFNENYTTKQLNLVGIKCDGIR